MLTQMSEGSLQAVAQRVSEKAQGATEEQE